MAASALPLLLTHTLLLLLPIRLRGQGLGDVSFAVCDSSDPRQQWCVTAAGAIKDKWGRCLTRHDCEKPAPPDKVIVDSCTMGACAGSQLWHFDEDEGRIAAKLPSTCGHPLSGGAGCTCWDGGGSCPGTASACLDISVMDNSAQTYGCKKHDASKGDGYCGDANQHWELRDDGTLAVSTQSKVLLTAYVLRWIPTYYAFTFTRRRQTVDSTLPHIVRSSDHCLCLSTVAWQTLCKSLSGFAWADCSDPAKPGVKSNPCGPACLVTAPAPPVAASKAAAEFAGSGVCTQNCLRVLHLNLYTC